jgi:hypothetical protein
LPAVLLSFQCNCIKIVNASAVKQIQTVTADLFWISSLRSQ